VALGEWGGPSLRLDVDALDDLRDAVATVGPATTAVISGPSSLRRVTGSVVQATVRSFDPSNRTGTVLRDDGLELDFDSGAFDAGGALRLRLGQRVRLTCDDDGVVTTVTLATVPGPDSP
jgi:2-phospho-L-lactate guanylyltransferase